MDENREDVQYSFTGDVSSLRDAVSDALNLLSKYDSSLKKIATQDAFAASKTSVAGFQRSLNGVIRKFNSLGKFINKTSSDRQQSLAPNTEAISGAYKNIADVFTYLDTSTKATSEDFNLMSSVLRDASQALDPVVSKAQALSSVLQPVGSVAQAEAEQVEQSSQQTVQSIQNMSQQVSSEYKRMIENAPYLAYIEQLEQQMNRTSKSAEESMKAMFAADPALKYYDAINRAEVKLTELVNKTKQTTDAISSRFNSIKNTLSRPFQAANSVMQSYKDKASKALNTVTKVANEAGAAFRRAIGSTRESASAADASAAKHRTLGSVLKSVLSSFNAETSALNNEEKSLRKKNQTLNRSKKSHNDLKSALNKLGNTLRTEISRVTQFSSRLNLLNSTLRLVSRAFVDLTGIRIGQWLASAAKESIDFAENLNLFTVAMGNSVDMGLKFVNTMSELYGMDPSNLYRYSGYFYQLTDAIGMTADASAVLSLSMTKAANDIASLFNVDIGTVVDNLASGMQGMSRAVRKYGMDIRATTLQETAYAYGLTEKVANMSEANRMALRYLTMMNQVRNATKQLRTDTDGTTKVIGDFAATIETPANQLRIFKEQVTQLGRAIGNFFIPALQKVLPLINGFIMALRTILTFLGAILGFTKDIDSNIDLVGDSASSIAGIGKAAEDSTKSLKRMLAPFDELVILSQDSQDAGSGIGVDSDILDPALAEAIKNMSLELDNIRMKAHEVRDSLLEFFGFETEAGVIISWNSEQFEQNLIDKFPQWTQTIQAFFDNWSEIVEGFKSVWNSLLGILQKVLQKILGLFGFVNDDSVADFVNNLATNLDKLSKWLDENADKIAKFIVIWLAFKTALSIVTPIITGVSALAGVFKTLWSVGRVLVTGLQAVSTAFSGVSIGAVASVAAIVAAVVALIAILVHLWNTNDDFKESLIKGWETLKSVFVNIWEKVLKPVIDNIISTVTKLWQEHIKPVVNRIIEIVGKLVEALMALWNGLLAPVLNWLISSFGPSVAKLFNDIWDAFIAVLGSIFDTLDALLSALGGVLDFITGVFTGDWERAWKGLVNIFVGVGNAIIGIFETAVNGIISLINSVVSLVFNSVVGLINTLLGGLSGLASLVGINFDVQIENTSPQIPYLSIPRIPEMASGGVVTSPTYAILGEGRYDEAVIPLGNSPQMAEFVDQIVEAFNKDRPTSDQPPIEVHVYIDSREVTSAQNNTNRRFGKTTQKV